jgi:hypothetical protein
LASFPDVVACVATSIASIIAELLAFVLALPPALSTFVTPLLTTFPPRIAAIGSCISTRLSASASTSPPFLT